MLNRIRVKMPRIISAFYPKSIVWNFDSTNEIYLTFDDGPHPEITSFVLDELKRVNAIATFFCIGKNVDAYPHIFERIQQDGHAIGNHTQHHLNGWHSTTDAYVKDLELAEKSIPSKLFRPPYGRVKRKQIKAIEDKGYRIVLWSVLSGDFDTALTPEKCWEDLKKHIMPGAILVFHDSEKAYPRLKFILPKVIQYCINQGIKMSSIPEY